MDLYVVTASFPCMDLRCLCLRKKEKRKGKEKEKEINTYLRCSEYPDIFQRRIYRFEVTLSSNFALFLRVLLPVPLPPPELLKTIKRRCKIFLSR